MIPESELENDEKDRLEVIREIGNLIAVNETQNIETDLGTIPLTSRAPLMPPPTTIRDLIVPLSARSRGNPNI